MNDAPLDAEDAVASMRNISSFHDLISALDVSSIEADEDQAKRQEFITDCEVLRKRERKRRRGLINPRSKKVQYWDMTTTLALLFTATITPFEVCLGLETAWNALLYVNLVVNSVFMIDIIVQFFLPIIDPATGELIRNHKRIAERYLKTWFLIDVGTVLPFDLVTVAAPDLFAVTCGSGSSILLKGVKLLRTLRLVKLVRVLRASRIVQRWESAISISTST